MKIKTTGLREATRYLEKVAAPLGPEVITALESTWGAAFLDTQNRAHVLTGALKASGQKSSEYDSGQWEGRISYGGPGAEQAVYEAAKGAEHDPLSGMPVFSERLIDAIEKHFEP